jgi:CBS domain-containing protein
VALFFLDESVGELIFRMRTSIIRYRVADFLKRYPPFNEMTDLDLLDLASSGRVVFHESDEYIFQKDEERGPQIWVIQQGRVHLLSETEGAEHLKDILGEGDILGLGRILGKTQYRYSAKTESDVILYSIDGDTFEELARRNPKISKYLSAHFSLSERYADAARKESASEEVPGSRVSDVSWLEIAGPDDATLAESLIVLNESSSLQIAAQRMKQEERTTAAVVDSDGHLSGFIDVCAFRDAVAKDTDHHGRSVVGSMKRSAVISSRRATASDYFLEMLKSRSEVLAVTADGTSETNLAGFIEASHLALSTGWNPALLARELRASRSNASRKRHLDQATTMVASGLTDTGCVDQSLRLASELLDALCERLINITQEELFREDILPPSVEICWILFGSSARSENFPFRAPRIGAILDDSTEGHEKAHEYVSLVLERVSQLASSAGLPDPGGESNEAYCRTLRQWDEYFSTRISDPIGNQVYLSRETFDFRHVHGQGRLCRELKKRVELALEASSSFIAVLANDTMSNLPPLTFFHGVVVDLDGAMSETLDIEKTLLGPISDAARVLGLASKDMSAVNTLERLERGQEILPASVPQLLEAAEAFRIATYQSARSRLHSGTLVSSIRPSSLSRYDQRQLKNAFTAVQGLLELTATAFY